MSTTFEQARDHFQMGLAHLEAGRAAQAETALLASLALMPGRPSSLVNLAAARMAQDRHAEAVEDLEQALQSEPDHALAWSRLGEAQLALGQSEAALQAFDRAWALEAPSPALRYHRARALAAAQQAPAAWASLEPLLRDPEQTSAAALQLAGQLQQLLGQHAAAGSYYQRALARDPGLSRCWLLLGQLHQQNGELAEARAAFKHALKAGEDAELVRYLMASVAEASADTPSASPPAYVRSLFDPYAADFDEHLVNTLRYRGHSAVAEAALADPRPQWCSVLDLGCGTGLCGSLLRGRAQHLAGVDLSPTMIAHARRRGGYDALHLDDVVKHLRQTSARHDLVLAADVFIYIGDLRPVLAGVRRVLEPNGRFIFSIEHDDAADNAAGFVLRSSLRYAHAPAAIARLATSAGLALVHQQAFKLREEEGQAIGGCVLVLRPDD
jgi:predicted TPR repeat methyltransferase